MGFSLRRVRRFAVFLSGRVRRLSGKTRCSVCMKYYKSHNLKVLPHCAHNYCRDCLRRTFSRLLSDSGESTVPPRCCGHEITLAITGDFLDGVESPTDTKGLKEQYLQVLERRTNDPIFCSRGCIKDGDAEVGAGLDTKWFITPEEIKEEEDLAICGKCKGAGMLAVHTSFAGVGTTFGSHFSPSTFNNDTNGIYYCAIGLAGTSFCLPTQALKASFIVPSLFYIRYFSEKELKLPNAEGLTP
ncbi:uncharacterized protein H6S33_012086 [Morchella sextelata]|uniref:uncharacterized protein n=1 Tax=Morchella sextelata TaxID=1174677 RepID=UPI001D03BCD7|nr:uncharacterized protein H6S33_012086 [Morchella sextelata]KAH0610559.1 hypothetical protein H6S33_012086 [Morchella sextelata]